MTYPPKRILVPVDFGEASARALSVAGELARHHAATIEALHVEALDAPPYFTHDQVKVLEAQRANARAAAERYLKTFVQKHGAPGAAVTIADGAPAEVILRHASLADLVVMGTNDRNLAARLWMGSVAERVHRQASVPVLIVRSTDSRTAAEYATWLRRNAESPDKLQKEQR
jgi:nucleotide-binding universal stress UspA family protein